MPRKSLYLIGLIVTLGIGIAIGHTGWLATPVAEANLTWGSIPCPTMTIYNCRKGTDGVGTVYFGNMSFSAPGAKNIRQSGNRITWSID